MLDVLDEHAATVIAASLRDEDVLCVQLACRSMSLIFPRPLPIQRGALLSTDARAVFAFSLPGFDDGRACKRCADAGQLSALRRARAQRCCKRSDCHLCCTDPRCRVHTLATHSVEDLPCQLGLPRPWPNKALEQVRELVEDEPRRWRSSAYLARGTSHDDWVVMVVCAALRLRVEYESGFLDSSAPVLRVVRDANWHRPARVHPPPLGENYEPPPARCLGCGTVALEAELQPVQSGFACARCVSRGRVRVFACALCGVRESDAELVRVRGWGVACEACVDSHAVWRALEERGLDPTRFALDDLPDNLSCWARTHTFLTGGGWRAMKWGSRSRRDPVGRRHPRGGTRSRQQPWWVPVYVCARQARACVATLFGRAHNEYSLIVPLAYSSS